MAKEDFKIDLDFDLSKYNYESKVKPSFTLDEILGVSVDHPKKENDVFLDIGRNLTVEKPTDDMVSEVVEAQTSVTKSTMQEADNPKIGNEPVSAPSFDELSTSVPEVDTHIESSMAEVPETDEIPDESPMVNVAAFDAIKAQEKAEAVHVDKTVSQSDQAHSDPVEEQEESSGDEEERREDVLYTLNHLRRKITLKAAVMFLLLLCSLYFFAGRISFLRCIIPSQLNPDTNPQFYCMAFLGLAALAFLLNISPLFDGLKKAFSARLTADGVAFCLGLSCIVYDVYYVLNPEKFAPLMLNFDIIFILMLCMNLMGKRLLVKHITANYELISQDCLKSVLSGPYGVAIDNDVMIETGNGGDILYASKTKSVADYMNKAFAEQNVNRKTDVFYFCIYGAIAVFGILMWVIKAIDFQLLITLLVASCAICAPVFATWTHTLSSFRLGRFLRSKRTVISGREGATAISERGVVVVRDTDLISMNDITLRAMNVREEYDPQDILRYLSALFSSVGGPLKGFFDKTLSTEDVVLPKVEDVYFHEQLGYTFTADGKRLSVGTDEFMRQCRIECPINPAISGSERVYVAIDEQLVGVFSLTYQLSQKTVNALHLLEDEGVSVAILTVDFNLRETMFSGVVFDPDMITVLSDETAKNCMTLCDDSESCAGEIVTLDAIVGMALGLVGCNKVLLNCERHSIYRITASLFGLLIIFLLGYLAPSLSFWLPLQILLYQILWSLPNFFRGINQK